MLESDHKFKLTKNVWHKEVLLEWKDEGYIVPDNLIMSDVFKPDPFGV